MRSDETLDRWKKRSGRKCEVWWKARNTDNKLKLVERLKQKALFLVFFSSQFPRFSSSIFFRTSHLPHSSFSRHSLSYYFLPHSEFSTLWSTIFSQTPHFIPHSSFSALCIFYLSLTFSTLCIFFHSPHFPPSAFAYPQSSFTGLANPHFPTTAVSILHTALLTFQHSTFSIKSLRIQPSLIAPCRETSQAAKGKDRRRICRKQFIPHSSCSSPHSIFYPTHSALHSTGRLKHVTFVYQMHLISHWLARLWRKSFNWLSRHVWVKLNSYAKCFCKAI